MVTQSDLHFVIANWQWTLILVLILDKLISIKVENWDCAPYLTSYHTPDTVIHNPSHNLNFPHSSARSPSCLILPGPEPQHTYIAESNFKSDSASCQLSVRTQSSQKCPLCVVHYPLSGVRRGAKPHTWHGESRIHQWLFQGFNVSRDRLYEFRVRSPWWLLYF